MGGQPIFHYITIISNSIHRVPNYSDRYNLNVFLFVTVQLHLPFLNTIPKYIVAALACDNISYVWWPVRKLSLPKRWLITWNDHVPIFRQIPFIISFFLKVQQFFVSYCSTKTDGTYRIIIIPYCRGRINFRLFANNYYRQLSNPINERVWIFRREYKISFIHQYCRSEIMSMFLNIFISLNSTRPARTSHYFATNPCWLKYFVYYTELLLLYVNTALSVHVAWCLT